MNYKILAIVLMVLTISSCSAIASASVTSSIEKTAEKPSLYFSGWEQINEDGFGSRNNIAPRGTTIFNDTLVVGTMNVIDYWAGLNTSQRLKEFLKSSIIVKLWKNFQSNGCEIWSYDGTALKQIVGDNDGAVMKAGFGNKNNLETGTLIEYKGYLYAGVHNQEEGGQIWRTKHLGEEWELVINEGFGDKTNAAVWVAEIFNDYLYVGTMNLKKGFEIYRTNNGVSWENVVGRTAKTKRGFGTRTNFYAWSSCVYDNWLYIGTANLQGGGELWKTQDGITWIPVLAYKGWIPAKLHGADYPRGFDSGPLNYRGGIRKMIVYNDELYCGFTGEDIEVSIWLSQLKVLSFRQQAFLLKLRPFHYRDSLGLEIWKYNAGQDKWTRVVGGDRKSNFSGGFGDFRNEYPWSMTVHEGHLYVGTFRLEPIDVLITKNRNDFLIPRLEIKVSSLVGGAELWRFDIPEWQRINERGFGDLNNVGIRSLIVYQNCLIGLTMNFKTGCEMWRYTLC